MIYETVINKNNEQIMNPCINSLLVSLTESNEFEPRPNNKILI